MEHKNPFDEDEGFRQNGYHRCFPSVGGKIVDRQNISRFQRQDANRIEVVYSVHRPADADVVSSWRQTTREINSGIRTGPICVAIIVRGYGIACIVSCPRMVVIRISSYWRHNIYQVSTVAESDSQKRVCPRVPRPQGAGAGLYAFVCVSGGATPNQIQIRDDPSKSKRQQPFGNQSRHHEVRHRTRYQHHPKEKIRVDPCSSVSHSLRWMGRQMRESGSAARL